MKGENREKAHNYSAKRAKKKEPRIYLSGAITGIPHYKKDFELVETELLSKGYRYIVNPAELDEVIVNGEYENFMDVCLKLIDMCDIVVLIPGWKKSAGANREMGYALGKGKEVVTYEDLEIEDFTK